MKMAKEQEHPARIKKEKSRQSKSSLFWDGLTEEETVLFEKLRLLRTEIAKEERVPPYIVFSDKTLIHMCKRRPSTKEEMLQVSGVGEFKE